ncbi:hypothetical protein BRPE64_BCDS13900 [Caballeronia insecticola]|uniref:Uncharacterized protein n=1 Tax=Caballeronia insecticola TaxID=758793 RepID=R4X1C0_9BURK|nr:hypothetical protein BRPE64_BCDS13900 [Caballeronia insecticola]
MKSWTERVWKAAMFSRPFFMCVALTLVARPPFQRLASD